jgi:hypothetical protein
MPPRVGRQRRPRPVGRCRAARAALRRALRAASRPRPPRCVAKRSSSVPPPPHRAGGASGAALAGGCRGSLARRPLRPGARAGKTDGAPGAARGLHGARRGARRGVTPAGERRAAGTGADRPQAAPLALPAPPETPRRLGRAIRPRRRAAGRPAQRRRRRQPPRPAGPRVTPPQRAPASCSRQRGTPRLGSFLPSNSPASLHLSHRAQCAHRSVVPGLLVKEPAAGCYASGPAKQRRHLAAARSEEGRERATGAAPGGGPNRSGGSHASSEGREVEGQAGPWEPCPWWGGGTRGIHRGRWRRSGPAERWGLVVLLGGGSSGFQKGESGLGGLCADPEPTECWARPAPAPGCGRGAGFPHRPRASHGAAVGVHDLEAPGGRCVRQARAPNVISRTADSTTSTPNPDTPSSCQRPPPPP